MLSARRKLADQHFFLFFCKDFNIIIVNHLCLSESLVNVTTYLTDF
ncbi:hypothetical protein [Klebsiella pneumoniae IS10]|nr:hypothetical protein [Klebsiella pneumoniae IS10]